MTEEMFEVIHAGSVKSNQLSKNSEQGMADLNLIRKKRKVEAVFISKQNYHTQVIPGSKVNPPIAV